MITDTEWNQFFDLLKRIVHSPGNWKEKKALLEEHALMNATVIELYEFVKWYEGTSPDGEER